MIKTKTENSITFHIETLERPDNLVDEKAFSEIAQTFSSKIEYLPNPDEKLISGGSHAFLYGLYLAYSQHRPFTLSPDMIWLLVLQGISNHVNFSHASGGNLFPHLTEKRNIVVHNKNIILGDPKSPWHETTEEFSNQIEEIVGSEIVSALRADFSTTTQASKIVSEITIMDTFKPYFNYITHRAICGIPELKLEGSVADWNRVLEKLEVLKKYNLTWWYDDLKPIITKIKNTAEEIIDNEFWMHIFKIHTVEEYGNPKTIDGWITKFFPFTDKGFKFDITESQHYFIEDIFKILPKQVISVNFIHLLSYKNKILEKTDMEYWGGFVGISQDHDTQFLKPEINWFVSHASKPFEKDVDPEREASEYYIPSKVFHNITSIPEEVFETKKWGTLALIFLGKAEIPKQLKDLEFADLHIHGTINEEVEEETKERLKSYFNWKKTRIYINGERLGVEIIPTEVYQKHIKDIKEKYIPKTGKSNYVQGEMLRVLEILETKILQNQDKKLTKTCKEQLIVFLEKYLYDYDEEVFFGNETNEIYFIFLNFTHYQKNIDSGKTNRSEVVKSFQYIKERIVDWHLHYGPTKLEEDPKLCL